MPRREHDLQTPKVNLNAEEVHLRARDDDVGERRVVPVHEGTNVVVAQKRERVRSQAPSLDQVVPIKVIKEREGIIKALVGSISPQVVNTGIEE